MNAITKPSILLLWVALVGAFLYPDIEAQAQCTGVNFTANTTVGCSPVVSRFTASGGQFGTTYSWDFGGGAVSGSDTITKVFTVPGYYDITLTITGPTGTVCTVTQTKYIEVTPAPVLNFTVSPGRILCNPSSRKVTFKDNSPNVQSREWVIDGRTYSNAPSSITHTFTSAGFKSVVLRVTNSSGCVGLFSDNQYIKVIDSTPVEFCGEVVVSATSVTGKFKSNVSGIGRTVTSYNWTFAGGSPATYNGSTPGTVTWPKDGKSYDVTLSVSFADGCTYTAKRKNYIAPFIAIASPTNCINTQFTVTNLINKDGRGNWDFNSPDAQVDPLASTAASQRLTYNKAGVFDFTMGYKYSTQGCIQTVKVEKYVTITGPASFPAIPEKVLCRATDTIHLQNRSVEDGAPNVTYQWYIFDDKDKVIPGGKFRLMRSIRDTFFVPGAFGTYGFALVAKSTNGCKDSAHRKMWTIVNSPKFKVEADTNNKYCSGNTVTFKVVADPPDPLGAYKYIWNLRNVDSPRLVYTFIGKDMSLETTAPGRYNANVVIEQTKTCKDTLHLPGLFTIYGAVLSMDLQNLEGCAPHVISALGLVKFKWPNNPFNNPTLEWEVTPSTGVFFDDKNANKTNIYISDPGCYEIRFLAKDTKGCLSSVTTKNICIGVSPGFDVSNLNGSRDTVVLTNNTYVKPGSTNIKYKWKANPSAQFFPSDTSANPQVATPLDTCYDITLVAYRVTPNGTCIDSSTKSTCCTLPQPVFSALKDTYYCSPVVVSFKSTVPGAKVYKWEFGDGYTLITDNPNPSYVYPYNNTSGWDVKLTVFDTLGCNAERTIRNAVKIIGPSPKFSMSANKACDYLDVSFTDLSKDVPKGTVFFHDDGTTPSLGVPSGSHRYTIPTYARDSFVFRPGLLADDGTCKSYFDLPITLYRTPSINVTRTSLQTGCAPYRVTFQNNTQYANRFKWDYDGNGTIDDTTRQGSFIYLKPGNYTPRLYVTNGGGCSDSFTLEPIKVVPLPHAAFGGNIRKACGFARITFTDSSKNATRREVDFGDGSGIDTTLANGHTFILPPASPLDSIIYTIRLVAFNAAGCSDTTFSTVTIFNRALPRAILSDTAGCSPLSVRFTNASLHSTSAKWDFNNDGKIDATGDTVFHTYISGIYSPKLIVQNAFGCRDSITLLNQIRVPNPPVADFTVSDTFVCFRGNATFTSTSISGTRIQAHYWDFDESIGTIDSATGPTVTHTFTRAGMHNIRLVVQDIQGCRDTIYKMAITVDDTFAVKPTSIASASVNADNSITITWYKSTLPDAKNYSLQVVAPISGTLYTTLSKNDTSFNHASPAIAPDLVPVSYTVSTFDLCGNLPTPSTLHQTIKLQTAKEGKDAIRLTWNPYIGWDTVESYTIMRAIAGTNSFIALETVPGNETTWLNSPLCGDSFTYYLVAKEKGTNITANSNRSSQKSPYVLPTEVVTLGHVTVVDIQDIAITWLPLQDVKRPSYHLDRKAPGKAWSLDFAQTSGLSYLDNKTNPSQGSYTYRIWYMDSCGNKGPVSIPSNSIWLTHQANSQSIPLHWTPYTYWANGVNYYRLQVKNRAGKFVFVTQPKSSDSTYNDSSIHSQIDSVWCYRIVAYKKDVVADSSISNITCPSLPAIINVPNAFSPNGDGKNDLWFPKGIFLFNNTGIEELDPTILVFNRWGGRVYQSHNLLEGWDGKDAAIGVYLYVIQGTATNGEKVTRSGNITLLK